MELTPPILVIGVGNDLRGDDAAGWLVVATVEAWKRPGVRCLRVRQLTPELVDELADAATVVVIDASCSGSCQPELQRVTPDVRPVPLSHTTSLPRLLTLVLQLHGRSPGCWLLGMPAESFDFGATPSPLCEAGIEAALARLDSMLPRQITGSHAVVEKHSSRPG